MPWKSVREGEFAFSGPISEWMQAFQKWYPQDTKSNPSLDFAAYLQAIVPSYAQMAKGKWEKERFGRRKAAKLDSFASFDAQGNVVLKLFDTLDFLAENLDHKTRLEWSSWCRSEAQRLMGL